MKNKSYWLFGTSILLLICSIALNISHSIITNESIVLTFIGILATFILVGNYAQVTEIRNSTQAKVDEQRQQTEKKLAELQTLYHDLQKKTETIKQLEYKIHLVSADASRILGGLTSDTKAHRSSVEHLIQSIYSLYKSKTLNKSNVLILDKLIGSIINSLEPNNWNCQEAKFCDFDFEYNINLVKNLPSTTPHKEEILNLLEKRKNEVIKN
jgi:hypothetical protein